MDTPTRDRHIPELLSLAETAEVLGVSRNAVHKMATKGQLAGAQAGTTWVFRKVVVERAKAERAGAPAVQPDDAAK